MRILIALSCLSLGACASLPQSLDAPVTHSTDWRRVVTDADRARLRDWRTTFTRAIEQARRGGHASDIAAEGILLNADAATGPIPIADGNYWCRIVKVGAKSEGMLDYIAYPAFACRIARQGELQSFTKVTGSQRHVGLIYPADALRQVFLGTLVLGDEQNAMQYGRDPDRDLAGWVERIGDNRWRIVLPEPRYESMLDIIELVPAG